MPKIVLIDDEAGIAEMAESLIRQQIYFSEGHVLSTFASAVEWLPRLSPNIVVLDNRLTDGCGLDLVRLFKNPIPEAKWLVYSGYLSKNTLQRAIAEGIDGAVAKRAPHKVLIDAVRTLLGGRRFFCEISTYELARCDGDNLTRTERLVVQHVSSGLTPKEIAERIGVAHKTVLNCLVTLRCKIKANSFVRISDYARKHGLSELDGA